MLVSPPVDVAAWKARERETGHDLAAFVDLVHRRAQKGRAYLIISHRLELGTAAHRRIEIRDEKIVEVSQ